MSTSSKVYLNRNIDKCCKYATFYKWGGAHRSVTWGVPPANISPPWKNVLDIVENYWTYSLV